MTPTVPLKSPLISRDSITRTQLDSLLSTAATMSGLLFQQRDSDEPEGGKMDGGVKAAIETTLMQACSRIDEVLADSSRWSMKTQDTLEDLLAKMYQSNQDLLASQIRLHETANAPHARFRPTLKKLPDGMWIAMIGRLDDLENALVGIGDCPAKAIKAFDMLFNGELPPHVLEWMLQREAEIKQDQPPTDSPNVYDKKTDSKSPVDTGGTNQASPDANPASAPARNRRKPRQNRPPSGSAA